MSNIAHDKELVSESESEWSGSLNSSLATDVPHVEVRKKIVSFARIIWLVWWIGFGLIALSWVDLVGNTVGWIGFFATLISSLSSVVVNKYWRIPT